MQFTIYNSKFTTVVLAIAVLVAPRVAAQTQIDGVLLRFGSDVVTQSDVREARVLKLLDVSDATDQGYVDALVNRRLMLAELRRASIPDPATAQIDARYQKWVASLGAGADVPALLGRVGMSEAGLRGWLRDDLRLQSYLDQRFVSAATRSADLAAWIAELRKRAGLK
jgi:hypothetical protein